MSLQIPFFILFGDWALAPSNISIFVWRIVLDRLPSRVNLHKRKIILSAEEACCPICSHALLLQHYCPFMNLKQNLMFQFVWFAVAWRIWNHRNGLIVNSGTIQEGMVLLERAQHQAWLWLKGRIKGFHFSWYEWISEPKGSFNINIWNTALCFSSWFHFFQPN